MDEKGCTCGLLVFEAGDLDEVGSCVVCAGSGHDWGCGCVECAVYWEGAVAGEYPTVALERALADEVGALA
ncbi:MAG: hypothetical protein H0V25_05005 [Solirubrobacterales bacterium]|nr:hypothetical protein [Solirubrobacterales bacterium]